MTFLEEIISELKKRIRQLLKIIDQPLAEATVNYKGRNGQELTSPLIEIAVRRAVSAVLIAAGAALTARIPKESQVSVLFYNAFTHLSEEMWFGEIQ